MTVRLPANENWPRPALLAIRSAGIDVEAIAELMPGATDPAVLRHAASTGRWLLTFDRDYGELVFARTVPPPPAIVYLRQCGLILLEQDFDDNVNTLRDQAVHATADKPGVEIRKRLCVERALPLYSDRL